MSIKTELTKDDLIRAWKSLRETEGKRPLLLTSDIYDLCEKAGLPLAGIIRVNLLEGTTNAD
jgi:hypothetical protein